MQIDVTPNQIAEWRFPHQIEAELSDVHLLDAYKGAAFIARRLDQLGQHPDDTSPDRMGDANFMRFTATELGHNLGLIEKYLGIRFNKKDYLDMAATNQSKQPVGEPALTYGEACVIARTVTELEQLIHREVEPPLAGDLMWHVEQIKALLNVKE